MWTSPRPPHVALVTPGGGLPSKCSVCAQDIPEAITPSTSRAPTASPTTRPPFFSSIWRGPTNSMRTWVEPTMPTSSSSSRRRSPSTPRGFARTTDEFVGRRSGRRRSSTPRRGGRPTHDLDRTDEVSTSTATASPRSGRGGRRCRRRRIEEAYPKWDVRGGATDVGTVILPEETTKRRLFGGFQARGERAEGGRPRGSSGHGGRPCRGRSRARRAIRGRPCRPEPATVRARSDAPATRYRGSAGSTEAPEEERPPRN